MKIMVIDGNSILNRAFYGVRLLKNHEGFYTNAIYGFLSTLFKLQDEEMPEHTIVCFDVKEKTFRHKKFDSYKANRKGMPDELAVQLPVMKDILDKLGITRCEKAGYEADDLIGTISRIVGESSNECVIVTGDKDSLQLVGNQTSVRLVTSKMGQSSTTKYDEQVFEEEYGFEPAQLVDLKALMGDTSDNISGVAGIGKKTANDLVKSFGSLENIYKNIDSPEIKKGVREKLINGEQSAKDSYWLATIDRNVPLDIDPINLPDEFVDEQALYEIFNKLELKTFINRLGLSGLNENNIFEQKDIEILNIDNFDDALNKISSVENKEELVFVHINKTGSAVCMHTADKYYIIMYNKFSEDEWFEILRRIFSGKLNLVMHDAKEQIIYLMQMGIFPEGINFDTCIAAYLLNPVEGSYDLQRVALAYCQIELKTPTFDKEDAFLGLIDNEDCKKELARWVEAIEYVYNEIMPKLDNEPQLKKLYYDLELPLMTVLADMQKIGCKVDADLLGKFGIELDKRIELLIEQIYDYAGEEFKINSPKQLGEILFDKLGLPAQKKTKSGYSTNAEVLEAISGYHPIINAVLEYRQLTKLKSTYVDGLLKVISPVDGRIHSHFQQTVTATGRLSSVDPNLQNIPVRTELGRELRKMFVAQDKNHVLIDADYSQIELRVLAHIAQDENMLEAFRNGKDIHAATASKVYGVPIEDVTTDMRSSCKAVNFGIVYGISDFALAGDLGISQKQAGEFIKSYLETYIGVDKYMNDIKVSAKEKGYVETLFGRRRYLPELSSKSFPIRSFGERAAMNTPIQGTAADIIKIAMLRVWKRLRSEGYKAKLILQVHDELILEAPLDECEKVKSLLTEEMENAIKIDVPLIAEAHFGHDWYTAKEQRLMKLGILGTGMIAQEVLQFIDKLDFESVYILSTEKSKQKALELKQKYNIQKCFTDFDDMLKSDADVLYIALPNHLHYEFAKKAIENGKHIILEKPSTPSLSQFEKLETLAKENNVYLLEAVNLYHLPAYKSLKNDINKIGQIKIVSLNYSQYSSRYDAFKQGNILPVFDVNKCGGALMDINVYNIHASLGLFGEPENVEYFPNIEKGIDTSGIFVMSYKDFKVSCIGAKDCKAQSICTIQGELGTISFEGSVSMLTEYKISLNNGTNQVYKTENPEHRLIYEFKEFIRIIKQQDNADNLLKNSKLAVKLMENAREKAGIYFKNLSN